jgi:hypothetical protein
MILAILGCDAGGQNIGSAKNHQRDKGILKTHFTAQYTVTYYSLPGL